MDFLIKSVNNNVKLIKNIQKFLFSYIKQEFGFDYVPEWHEDIINFKEYYIDSENNNFFVALNPENYEIIATIGVRAYDKHFEEFKDVYSKDNTASIWRLFVDKNYRRCGLASKMFYIAENFAMQSNYQNIYLHTHKTLNGALEFWMKMGFIVTLDCNDNLQTVHMDKQINTDVVTSFNSMFNYALEF